MIKIIVVHHTLPSVKGFTTTLFKNLMPILQEKIEVNLTWVIHSETKISEYKCEKYEKIIRMNEYNDAFEILEKEKPDLIYIIPGINVPDYAFSLADKSLKIFIIGSELGNVLFTKKSKIGILSQIKNNKENNETNQIQKFFNNHRFLIKTQKRNKWNYFKIFFDLCSIFFMYFPVKGSRPDFSTKFQLDLHFVESELTVKTLTDLGFEKSKIMITGNPSYDKIFENDDNLKKTNSIKQKCKILILTTTIYGESRNKTIRKRNLFITEVIEKIIKNDNEIVVKIHPTHENLDEYRKIIDKIDPEIPVFQEEDLKELIENTDLIITPVSNSSVISGLIQKKQIIIWNVFDVQNDILLENNLAVECKDPNELLSLIEHSKKREYSNEKVDEFISKYLFKADGKATERIAKAILKILENK